MEKPQWADELINEVSGLREQFSEVKNEVSGLREQSSEVKNEVSGLREQSSEVKNEVRGLKEQVAINCTKLDTMNKKLDNVIEIATANGQGIETLSNRIDKLE